MMALDLEISATYRAEQRKAEEGEGGEDDSEKERVMRRGQ
jgi:hypothetical protein